MARYRTVKPELFTDEKLAKCSIPARLLFIGLLCFSEDMGRRRYNPARIMMEVFPGDGTEITPGTIDDLVGELAKVGVVELYEVKRKRYLRIPHFLDHQYVRKPSHCTAPPAPSEGPDAVICLCANCKMELAKSNGRMFLQERTSLGPHSERTSDALVPHSDDTSEVRVPTGIGIGIGVSTLYGKSREDLYTHGALPESAEDADPQGYAPSEENRRAQSGALDEIARKMIALLQIPPNSLNLHIVTDTLKVRARTKNFSLEASAQQLTAKAALIGAENPPEDWNDWFFDARYEYVPQGDSRLGDKRLEARATCGGPRCYEGWEPVRIGTEMRARRCPDCVRLWHV